MHDSVGHSLTAQSIQLENVAMWLPQNTVKATDHLQKARQLGKEALHNVRQSVSTLRTDPLKGLTLASAVDQLIQKFERRTHIQVQAQLELNSTHAKEMATAVYRTIQEALTNISKHSEANQVNLVLRDQATVVYLLISDNGKGFDPIENTTGFGLQSMRERAEALGGAFQLSSQIGQGCRIQVEIPRMGGMR